MSVKLDRIGAKKEKAHTRFDEAKKEMEAADAEYKAEEDLEAGDAIREHHVTPDMLIKILESLGGNLPGNLDIEKLFETDSFTDHDPSLKYEADDYNETDDEDGEDEDEEEMI